MDPRNIPVAEIMSTTVLPLRAGTTLREAMTALEARGMSGAPVVDDTGRCVGIFSLTNVARAGNFFGIEPPVEAREGAKGVGSVDEETVADWMSRDVKYVAPTTSVEATARLMTRASVHRLLVIDEGAIVGIVSSLDFVRLVGGFARAEEPETLGA
jgi:CBS domain-containing protein